MPDRVFASLPWYVLCLFAAVNPRTKWISYFSNRRERRERRGRRFYCSPSALSAVVLLVLVSGAARAQHPAGVGPGQTYHRIFVTSNAYGISSSSSFPPPLTEINGLPGADWHVTLAAFDSGLMDNWNGLDLVYTALLSTADVDAHTRQAIQGKVFNTQDEQVADDGADLWDASLDAAVRYDEFGNAVSSTEVWTGSTGFGNFTGTNCGCWTDSSTVGEYGNATRTNTSWMEDGFHSCSNTGRLYGISPPITVPLVGDHNDDGTVDAADYVLWRKTDGTPQGYADWRTHFGQTAGSGSASSFNAAVPEPSSALLLILAAAVVSTRRRQIAR